MCIQLKGERSGNRTTQDQLEQVLKGQNDVKNGMMTQRRLPSKLWNKVRLFTKLHEVMGYQKQHCMIVSVGRSFMGLILGLGLT